MHSEPARDGPPEIEETLESFPLPGAEPADFDLLSAKYVLDAYSSVVTNELRTRLPDESAVQGALEEWYYLAICPERTPEMDQGLQHLELLESLRPSYARVEELPEGSTWNEIVNGVLAHFEDPIEIGREKGWPWQRVLDVYRGSRHIDDALKYGADPDISPAELLEHLRNQNRQAEDRIREKAAENERMREELARKAAELNEKWGLPPDAPFEALQSRLNDALRPYLAELWGRDPGSISDDDILAFLESQIEE